MDTSKEYIEMCRKAEEIQAGHHWCEGDVFIDGSGDLHLSGDVSFTDGTDYKGEYYRYFSDGGCGCCSSNYEPEIWLPRQDQLQEMVPGYIERGHFAAWLADKFADFAVNEANRLNTEMSMEQLWLAFVMHEKYQKVWNGTEWVKE